MDNTINLIRKIASNDDDQNVFILAKDIGSIQIFKNNRDFTYIQHLYLKYLSFYYNLYSDIAIGDVDEIVMKNFLYQDAYMMYKNFTDRNKFKKQSENYNQEKQEQTKPTSQWIFKQPGKVK